MAASARDHEVQCSEVPLQDTVTGEGSWRDWRPGGICGARELFLQGQIWGITTLTSRAQPGIYEWPEKCVQNFIVEHTFLGRELTAFKILCRHSTQAKAEKPGPRSVCQPERDLVCRRHLTLGLAWLGLVRQTPHV